ncbi:MAG: 4'-phosphopantetheinyl transferase superfamily protein [Magnetospirillum sp.]|nr:MAG: 4'-phosphopantetheinyl transferase superfamily protein [Magnetospirillum sp.]
MTRWRLDQETWLYRGVADHPDARAAVVRRHLSEILRCDEGAVAIARSGNGKPYLTAPHADLWFNTAGRDGLLAIAISRRGPVGIDIETLAHCRDTAGVARTVFTAAEADWLDRQPPALRPLGFARLWTAKEAALKAHGAGIGDGLAEPDFGPGLTAGEPPWPPVVAPVKGNPYTVAWYTSTIDEAFVIAARAQAETGHFRTS